jgi:predicted phosphodiesterase
MRLRFVAISDTHLSEPELPKGDVLLHAGDLTYRGTPLEVSEAFFYLKKAKEKYGFKHVLLIAGNHDWLAQKQSGRFADMAKEAGLHYLFDSGVVIDPDGQVYPWDPQKKMKGIKVWGAPWQPWFYDWAFNLLRGAPLKEKWDLIPAGTDILITHGPPYGILDRAPRGYPEEHWSEQDFDFHSERVGCKDLLDAVMRVKPQVHVFGHIHADYGQKVFEGTHFINAAIMSERYDPDNKPVEFELDANDRVGDAPDKGSGSGVSGSGGEDGKADAEQADEGGVPQAGGHSVQPQEK